MTAPDANTPKGRNKRGKNKRPPTQPLSDNVFKEVTEKRGSSLGLENVAGELQLHKYTRSDLVLRVPSDVSLNGTIFDFFSKLNIIEFKSEDDNPLDDREFYKNVIRLYAIYEQDKKLEIGDLLNVIVSAAVPQKFLSFFEKTRYNFEEVEGRKWLRRGEFGNQQIAIVICELLPDEPKYYPWLLFAPAKSEAWRNLIRNLLLNGTYPDLLQEAIALRLEEVQSVYKEVKEMARSEKTRMPQWQRDRIEAFKRVLADERADGDTMLLDAILSTYPVEERMAGLKLEDVVAGLKPEERQTLLKLLQEQRNTSETPKKTEN